MSDVGTFADARDDLLFGSLSDESEVENTLAAPAVEPPATESLSTEDKPALDSAADGKPEEKQSEASTEPTVEAKVDAPVEQPTDEPVDDDPEIEINGEKVRLSELKQGYLRRSDYTRKRQEDSRRAEQAEQRVKETQKLASDIASDADMKEFLSAHPEALSYLLEQPEATRKLLGNSQGINDFWEDYETLAKNPRLAERLTQGDPEAKTAIQAEQTRAQIRWIGDSLDSAIAVVGESFPDIEPSQVESYLMELGGVTPDADADALVTGFGRLYNLLFVNTKEGVMIDPKLIRDRYEYLASDARSKKEREAKDAAKHNAEVDAELAREKDAPPATPSGGAPVAEAPKRKVLSSFEDTMQDLLYPGG